jgi:hypothetical protein
MLGYTNTVSFILNSDEAHSLKRDTAFLKSMISHANRYPSSNNNGWGIPSINTMLKISLEHIEEVELRKGLLAPITYNLLVLVARFPLCVRRFNYFVI